MVNYVTRSKGRIKVIYQTITLIKYVIKIAKQTSLKAKGHQQPTAIGGQGSKFDLQLMSLEAYNSIKMDMV